MPRRSGSRQTDSRISVGLSLGRSRYGHGMMRSVTVILWHTPEYTARRIFCSNMVLASSAAHAPKIACRQNRCADKSLWRARAVSFYLAYPRQRSFPVLLSSDARTAPAHRVAFQRVDWMTGACPATCHAIVDGVLRRRSVIGFRARHRNIKLVAGVVGEPTGKLATLKC